MSGPGFEPDLRESLQPAYATASEPSSFLPVKQSLAGMNGEPLRRMVTVLDPLGLHMRPLTVFAQKAAQYQSAVAVIKEGKRVNGKSPLELMLLAAEQGTELILEVSGPDAKEAMAPLAELLAAASADEDSGPPLAPKG
jgi:phosphocarrier protein HPr